MESCAANMGCSLQPHHSPQSSCCISTTRPQRVVFGGKPVVVPGSLFVCFVFFFFGGGGGGISEGKEGPAWDLGFWLGSFRACFESHTKVEQLVLGLFSRGPSFCHELLAAIFQSKEPNKPPIFAMFFFFSLVTLLGCSIFMFRSFSVHFSDPSDFLCPKRDATSHFSGASP